MLDHLIILVGELVLDGIIASAVSKNVPLPIRICLGVLICAIVLVPFGFLLYAGITSGSILSLLLPALLLAVVAILIFFRARRHKSEAVTLDGKDIYKL